MRRAGIVLLAVAAVVEAQIAEPRFDVASIRPSGPKSVRRSEGGPGSSDPELYRHGQATVLDLIRVGWNDVRKWQIQSPIALALEKKPFDLVARVPAGASKEQFQEMMRNLLAERFHLKLHIESQEFPAYELVIAKTGLKLKEGAEAPLRDSEGLAAAGAESAGLEGN